VYDMADPFCQRDSIALSASFLSSMTPKFTLISSTKPVPGFEDLDDGILHLTFLDGPLRICVLQVVLEEPLDPVHRLSFKQRNCPKYLFGFGLKAISIELDIQPKLQEKPLKLIAFSSKEFNSFILDILVDLSNENGRCADRGGYRISFDRYVS
jgi:hypothetical protein